MTTAATSISPVEAAVAPGPQDPGQRLTSGVKERQQRVVPEPALVGRSRTFLLQVCRDEDAVEVDHVEPRIGAHSQARSADRGTA